MRLILLLEAFFFVLSKRQKLWDRFVIFGRVSIFYCNITLNYILLYPIGALTARTVLVTGMILIRSSRS